MFTGIVGFFSFLPSASPCKKVGDGIYAGSHFLFSLNNDKICSRLTKHNT